MKRLYDYYNERTQKVKRLPLNEYFIGHMIDNVDAPIPEQTSSLARLVSKSPSLTRNNGSTIPPRVQAERFQQIFRGARGEEKEDWQKVRLEDNAIIEQSCSISKEFFEKQKPKNTNPLNIKLTYSVTELFKIYDSTPKTVITWQSAEIKKLGVLLEMPKDLVINIP